MVNILKNVEWQFREGYLYNNSVNHDISGRTLTLINFSNKDLGLAFNTGKDTSFTGVFSREITIPKNSVIYEKVGVNECLRTFLAKFTDGWTTSDGLELKNKLVVLEGEYSYDKLPKKYFEGMKSFGELEQLNLFADNKNLFTPDVVNVGDMSYNFNNGYIKSYQNGVFTIGTKNTASNGNESYTNPKHCMIRLKPNTRYYFSYKTDGVYNAPGNNNTVEVFLAHMKRDLGQYSVISSVGPSGISFTTDDFGMIGVRFDINNGVSEHKFYDLQIEEAPTGSDYIAPKRTSVNLGNITLRALPSGIKDKIIKKNGRWYIERNCGEQVVDTSNFYTYRKDEYISKGYVSLYYQSYMGYILSLKDVIAENYTVDFRPLSQVNASPSDTLTIYNDPSHSGSIFISFSFEKIGVSSTDSADTIVAKARNWLNTNPIKLTYKLESPIYEVITDINLVSILNKMSVSNNSTIPSVIKITFDRVANRARDAVEIARINPTAENISQARYWSNLMQESILKDSFQTNVNGMSGIVGLDIPQKNGSVNSDIYIKPKNNISLSLDTNSIVFDDINSVEGFEAKEAINLSVVSSIPYKINAYLEKEIQGSDGSNIINKTDFYIKASNTNDYKTFLDLKNPVQLLDNQEAGKNIVHGIDLKLSPSRPYKVDVYNTTIKFEIQQK